jgi:hypothetical protein
VWAGFSPSALLEPYDGYVWRVDGAPVAAGQLFTPSSAQIGHTLTCTETATYPLLGTTAIATSVPATVQWPRPPPPFRPAGPVAPVLAGLRESHRVWRGGSRLAKIARGRRPPVGTVFSFTLSEPARVVVTFIQPARGRKVRGRCVAQTHFNRHKTSCRRTLTRGTLSLAGHSGADRISFQGRLSSSRRLVPGAYTATLTATNGARQRSAPVSVRFTIVK